MKQRQQAYLDAMGIDIWVRRNVEPVVEEPLGSASELPSVTEIPSPPVTAERADSVNADLSQLDWQALRQKVISCQQCELHQTRIQTVFGVGNQQAEWMIIGEAPGADEDRQGEPFVGKAGKLLNAMLRAIGLQREEVYIANILKCRPPNNRDPNPEEAAQCMPYLIRQIQLVQPKLIVALGRVAAQRLLESNTSLGRMRGKLHHLEATGTPVIVTYHPAYLLRSPVEKAKAWDDLCYAKTIINSD